MRLKRTLLLAVLVSLALVDACNRGEPTSVESIPTAAPGATPTPTPAQAATPSPTPAPTPGPEASYVAYEDEGIHLYDVATNKDAKVRPDGRMPKFKGQSEVSYVHQSTSNEVDSVISFDVKGSDNRVDLAWGHAFGFIRSFEWTPDGKTLAHLVDAGGAGIKLFVAAEGPRTEPIRTFPEVFGREEVEDDDITLEYSPDGKMILLVDTGHASGTDNATMWVMRPDGSDAAPPRAGTFGRWAPDSKTVYYRELGDGGRWFALDVKSGSTTALKAVAGSRRLAVSPDGDRVAYDGAKGDFPLYVYDLAADKETKFASGGVGPVWLSSTGVANTRVSACQGVECSFSAWKTLNKTSRIATATGDEKSLPLRTTLKAQVLYVT